MRLRRVIVLQLGHAARRLRRAANSLEGLSKALGRYWETEELPPRG